MITCGYILLVNFQSLTTTGILVVFFVDVTSNFLPTDFVRKLLLVDFQCLFHANFLLYLTNKNLLATFSSKISFSCIFMSVLVLGWSKDQNFDSFGIILASRMENPNKVKLQIYHMFANTLNQKWKSA